MAAKHETGFEQYRRPTRRDAFLDTMNRIVPWVELCAVIEPHYPKRGNGRPTIGLERMLRIHFIQHWFNLTDFACEEALYDIASLRHFAGIDLGCEAVPGRVRLCRGQTAAGHYESALPWLGQEHGPRIYRAGISEHLLVQKPINDTGAPIVGE